MRLVPLWKDRGVKQRKMNRFTRYSLLATTYCVLAAIRPLRAVLSAKKFHILLPSSSVKTHVAVQSESFI
jgi:hypothetical protein